jgi:hypothetical protein
MGVWLFLLDCKARALRKGDADLEVKIRTRKPQTSKPIAPKVRVKKIPKELKKGKAFVVWSYKQKSGREGKPDKWDKLPLNPSTGKPASVTNPKTWCPFSKAFGTYCDGDYDGVGRVINEPYVGIDLDKCRKPSTGEIDSWAEDIIDKLDSYSEISPSGKGVKIWLRGALPKGRRRIDNIEMYDSGRYFTLTGHHLEGTPTTVEKRQEELEEVYQDLFPKRKGLRTHGGGESSSVSNNMTDAAIIKKALESDKKFKRLWEGRIKAYKSQSEADLALCSKLGFYLGRDQERIDRSFRKSRLYRKKWEREDYRNSTILKAIAETTETYSEQLQTTARSRQTEVEVSEFPTSSMAGVAAEFAELYSSYLEVPPHFFYMAFLTCLGSVVADRLTLASEVKPQPRLYVILLGESADDRKSTALIKVIEFFQEAIEDLYVCWGVGSAEGLQAELEQSRQLLLCCDEFKQFVNKCKIQGSTLLSCVNSLYEMNNYQSRTKKRNVQLEDVHLSFLAASTIATYENVWSSRFLDVGFNNRLFLVPGTAERKYSIPKQVPRFKRTRLEKRAKEILSLIGDGLKLGLTDDANELYHQWYMNLPRSIHSRRLDVYALRLMCLQAVVELKKEIDAEVVRRVTALCDWQYQVRSLYDPIDAVNEIGKMEERIRRVLRRRGPLKEWELRKFSNAHKNLWFYEKAKTNLQRISGELGFNKQDKTYFLK